MGNKKNRVCPVEIAGSLDNKLRRRLQNPGKILMPYVKDGMTALDMGCGPGFFTIEMACLVAGTGKVIAVDLQEGMLQKVRQKIKGTKLENRIILHKCEQDKIGVTEKVDFILTFYMVHEVPDKLNFFKELKSLLKKNGQMLIVEPKIFHVSRKNFRETIGIAEDTGLKLIGQPKIFMSQSALFIN